MKKQLLKIVKPMFHEWCVIQLGNKHGPQMNDTKSQLVKNTLDTLDNKNSSSDTVSTSDSSVVASNISVEVDGTLIPQGVHECDIDLSTESIQQNSVDRTKPSVQDRKARWTKVMEKQKINSKKFSKHSSQLGCLFNTKLN
jgi:hypothetical protein